MDNFGCLLFEVAAQVVVDLFEEAPGITPRLAVARLTHLRVEVSGQIGAEHDGQPVAVAHLEIPVGGGDVDDTGAVFETHHLVADHPETGVRVGSLGRATAQYGRVAGALERATGGLGEDLPSRIAGLFAEPIQLDMASKSNVMAQ